MNKENLRQPFDTIRRSLAGAFVAASIAGCSTVNPTIENPTIPTPITVPATQEILPQTNEQIIQEEVKRLGIQVSPAEGRLWHDSGYSRSQETKPINAVSMQEAAERVELTLSLMRQSKNPHLNNAANYISHLLSSETVRIDVYDKLEKAGYAMTTNAYLAAENSVQLRYRIKILANEIINNSSAITLACQLAHEIEHVKNMIEYQNSLPPNLSLQERIAKENERHENLEEEIAEEARGYSIQAKAYITAYGLGFKGVRNLNHEIYAAEFIKRGSNSDSIYWKNFIKQELARIKK